MTTVTSDRHAEPEFELELGLRERKKQQTRSAIHEAAFRLIDEQGLDATTIDQICTEADVSSRTFFNYFPSKAAALLQLPETAITDEVRARFLAADGGLVSALCDVIGSSTEFGPDHARMKQLVARRPELVTVVSGLMLELRSQFMALASERAKSPEHAELAITLVMAALGRVMHDDDRDGSLTVRLHRTVRKLVDVAAEELLPV